MDEKDKVERLEQQALEVLDAIADILVSLSDVASGDYSVRVADEYPDEHPLGALHVGINEMIDFLASERDRGMEYRAELEEKLATIREQQAAIRELSNPIIEVWRGVLCLPIIGVLDSTRSAEMTQVLLRQVTEMDAWYIIVDITGIEVMDTATVQHFVRMAKAVQLLGAECVMTGVNPPIAQTIVHMGLDLGTVASFRSLRDALNAFVRRSGAGSGVKLSDS